MKRTLPLLTAGLLIWTSSFRASELPAKPPNILFIITCQQFADAMSCRMGSQFLNTPTMDRLAQNGTSFTRAYTSNPLCMPARNSIFTGRYPHETGITKNSSKTPNLDSTKFPSLGSYFRDGGYDVAYSGKWHLCYDLQATNSHGFEILHGKGEDSYDSNVSSGVTEFLNRPHDKPFLVVASFLNPHNVCEWARQLAGKQEVLTCGEIGEPPQPDQLPPLPANFAPQSGEPDGLAYMRQASQLDSGLFPVGKFSVEDWRRLRWGYYRMIEKVDAEIGKVLDALRTNGFENNTLIVFTSDHGECAGAHQFNQKTVFYEESARVPLIIAGKNRSFAKSTDRLVNIGIDLLPTMLDFAGLETPKQLPGRSLMPLVLGKSVADWRDFIVVENHMAQAGEIHGFKPELQGRMLRTKKYKYCVYDRGNHRESLIDMEADPGEMTNLARNPKYHEILLHHRDLLAQFGKRHSDPLVQQLLADGVPPIPF